MSLNLLPTKFYIPPAHKNLIPRPRLVQILNDAFEQGDNFVLISAPAGYGKTTLVTEWLHGLPINTSWLSLDKADNDPARFLTYLIAALQQDHPAVGKTSLAILQSPQPLPPEALLTPLIHDIANIPAALLLVLDDYHVIETPIVHQQLNFLIENQPANLHLIIITREDPPIRLARLRVQGQMVEVRRSDLRFSLAECIDFFQHFHLPLDSIQILEHRTEGWIAGLQLAALSLQNCDDVQQFIRTFSGSSHFVLDFLVEEVFDRLPPDDQTFLLQTSILDQLSGPLCDAVTNRIDSHSVLDRLEHNNLFILPLDPNRTWRRYHHLFADLLRSRLHDTDPMVEKTLHERAGRWFASEGHPAEAIRHALAAQDWAMAAGLIEKSHLQMLRRGELMTLIDWLKALPEEIVRSHLQLCRDYGWALTLTNQLDAAVQYLDCAERTAQGNSQQLGQVLVAQAYLARARGDLSRAISLSKQALDLIADNDSLHRSLATFTLGFALFDSMHFEEAELALITACDAARASGNDYARLTALGLLGAIQKLRGRLHRGGEFCRQALQEARGSPAAAQVQVFLASILYEWNDLDAAEEQLDQALTASRYLGNRSIELNLLPIWVHIQEARGNTSLVEDRLNSLDQLIEGSDTPRTRAIIASIRADAALSQGDIPSACYWVQQMAGGLEPSALDFPHAIMQSRLFLTQGQRVEAGKILTRLYEQVEKSGMVSSMIQIRAMQALAAITPEEAIQYLSDGLCMGQAEGFIRTFVDVGEPMRMLLERLKPQAGSSKSYVLALLAAFGETKRLSISQLLCEPVSEREVEILHLLDDGLSNQEIADRLMIGLGTAKSHVHHILEKLGVSSRAQAVIRARELGML